MDLDHSDRNFALMLEISGSFWMVGDGGKKDTVQYFGHTQSARLDVVKDWIQIKRKFFASAFTMNY